MEARKNHSITNDERNDSPINTVALIDEALRWEREWGKYMRKETKTKPPNRKEFLTDLFKTYDVRLR